jgi:hypothetical protein
LGLLETIRTEWPVIKQAPVSITLSVLLLTGAATGLIYCAFHENLSRKEDLIHTLQGQLAAKKEEPKPIDAPKSALPSTGPATVIGNGSTAISGNGNSPQGTAPTKK